MKAMILTGLHQMELFELPDPQVEQPEQVLLKMAAVGVCGSDIHYYETGRIGSQVVTYPFRVGHECAATVISIGSAVSDLAPGDRVAIDPAMSCGQCDQCQSGRMHTCRNLRFLGCPGQAEGCLAEYILMPARSCYKIPNSMTFEQAALCEPLSIGYYAVQLSAKIANARVAILGAGPIGLSVLAVARQLGAAAIYVTDKITERVEMARNHGACWAGNPDNEEIIKSIKAKEPLLLDLVFECAGQQETIDQGIELLKPGGKLMIIGIPRSDRLSFAIDLARRKELCLQNVRRQNESVQKTIELIDSNPVAFDFMITHRFPFEKSKEAFDLVAEYKDGVVKAMIEF